MRLINTVASVSLAVAAVCGLSVTEANALPRCREPVVGTAAALGILGIGSSKARIEARRNWQAVAADTYGRRYAGFYNARNVRWDCKSGFIMPATCVVTASPCRY